jgi:hypothetical protein
MALSLHSLPLLKDEFIMSSLINNRFPQAPLEIPKSLQKKYAPFTEPVVSTQIAKPVKPANPSNGAVDLKA